MSQSLKRQLHLNANVVPSGRHAAAWRLQSPPTRTDDIEHLVDIARAAERGTFDAIFFADHSALPSNAPSRPWNALEPTLVLSAIARETTYLGMVATASTTFEHPYTVARRFASLDLISKGRAAWNIVTTHHPLVAGNYGLDALPPHQTRYERANEFVDVVKQLWSSWEPDALTADAATGQYLDSRGIHSIDHVGREFSVRGPLNVPRSPQGWPVLFQAGDSDASRTLGSRWADALFTVQRTFDEAQLFRRDVHARAARAGRNPSTLLVLPGLLPVVGSTDEEAWRNKRKLDELLDVEAERVGLANLFGVEPDRLALDERFPEDLMSQWDRPQSKGFAENLLREAVQEGWTVRETIWRNPGGHRIVAGSAERIADDMAQWFEGGAADGFNLNFDVYPSGLETFVESVVPLLRKKGIFRYEYEGRTLREHLGLAHDIRSRR